MNPPNLLTNTDVPDAPWQRCPAPRAAVWAFAVVAWLFATMALGGALGKSTDDYSTNLRDPVTGEVGSFRPFREYPYFWRPANVVAIHALQTFLWEHDRLLHAVGAGLHGLIALLLYRLLARATGCPAGAAASSLLFLALPVHFEAVFFTSTIGTLIGAALWLWLAIAATRYVRDPAGSRWPRLALPAIGVIALAIPWFYEQPGAAALAVPLAALAANLGGGDWKPRLRRACAVGVVIGLTQAGMAAVLLATAPQGKRGSVASLLPIEQWPLAVVRTAARLADLAFGSSAVQFARGGLALAWRGISMTDLWVWLVPLGLTGAAFCLAALHPSATRPGPASGPAARSHGVSRGLGVAASGLVASVLALVPPALVAGQVAVPRLTYMPLLGLAVALGGTIGVLGSLIGSAAWRVLTIAAAPVLVAATGVGATALVGAQRWFQFRSAADARIAEQFRTLPPPPAGTIFVPLRLDSNPIQSGVPAFDHARPGAFETIWSATAITRQTLRRRDVWSSAWNRWRAPPLDQPSDEGVRLRDRFAIWSPFPAMPDGSGTWLPWDRMLPLVVDASSGVRLIERLGIDDELALGRSVTFPHAARLDPAARTTFWLRDDRPCPGARPLTGWRSARPVGPGALPAFAERWIWDRRVDADWMHPDAEGGARAERVLHLEPATRARRIVVRVTAAAFDLDRKPHSARSAVLVRLAADPRQAAEIRLTPMRLRREQRWFPLVLTVPPTAEAITLRLEVRAESAAELLDVPIWVSAGLIADEPEPGRRIP